MPDDAHIRGARPADAEALSALALRSKAHWGYPAEFLDACRDELAVAPESLVAHPAFVAEEAGRAIGFCTLAPLSRSRIEIGHLFVEPERIGSGCGRRLLARALGRARADGYQTVVVQSDPHAEDFYRTCGAERVGAEPSASLPDRALPLLEIALHPPDPAPRLVSPRESLRDGFVEMAREFADSGDDRYALARTDFDAYLAAGRRFAADADTPPDRVPMDELWLVDGDRVLGGSRLRHRLIPALERDGGHIGYDVRPAERGRGYGHRLLALALLRARRLGLDRALLTCETANAASARVIERAGGREIEGSISPRTGAAMRRYWVPC